jgi:phospholipid transport system substrate-binding protein
MEIASNDANSPPVYVDYMVRGQGKGFKVFDVIVEGVSMIQTQRSEFASVLAKHDIDYLINQLASKSKTGDISLAGGKAKQ